MSIKRYRSHLFSIPVLLIAFVCLSSVEAQQGKVIYDTIHSPSLEGNLLKDPSTKPMNIYLPPSYDEGESLYPVIYYLHGYTANYSMWLNVNIISVMNNLVRQGKVQEMIIVMPDAYNKYGGSFYTNSPVAGKYEDYMTRDIIEFIDGKYRTLPQRESRGIGGGSMGGYGAMKLAMKHPDIYSVVVSHSGLLSLEYRKNFIRSSPNYTLYGYPLHRAMAIAWSPNPDDPLLYDYPADDKGNLVEEVWQQWLGHDPLTMVKTYQANLKQLSGIYFDQGRSDDLVQVGQARDFDKALTDAGIPHVYEEYSGGHTDQWTSRLYTALPFLSDLLSPEMLVSVESVGKLAHTWGEIRRGR